VLDLTATSRWTTFINAEEATLLGKSRLFYLQTQDELYLQFLQAFLMDNKVHIDSYDGIIARKFMHGGNQLHSQEEWTVDEAEPRVRALLRPKDWADRVTSAKGSDKAEDERRPRPVRRQASRTSR
jgi:hypothetical protein